MEEIYQNKCVSPIKKSNPRPLLNENSTRVFINQTCFGESYCVGLFRFLLHSITLHTICRSRMLLKCVSFDTYSSNYFTNDPVLYLIQIL